MTDPNDRCSRSKSMTPLSQAIPQPNFLAADLDKPRLHPMPILPRLNLQPPMIGVPAIPANSISLNDYEDDPFGFHDGPRHSLAPQRLAEEYGVYILLRPCTSCSTYSRMPVGRLMTAYTLSI